MRLHGFVIGTLAGATLLAGCAASGTDTHAWGSAHDYGKPGAVVSVKAGVPYYPACKNEILTFDGRTWFPFTPSNAADFPSDPLSADPLSAVPTPRPASGAADAMGLTGGGGPGAVGMGVHRVVAPGPGDDVGTLVIYENDLAYWQADSGGLHTWLTSQEIEYGWVC